MKMCPRSYVNVEGPTSVASIRKIQQICFLSIKRFAHRPLLKSLHFTVAVQ